MRWSNGAAAFGRVIPGGVVLLALFLAVATASANDFGYPGNYAANNYNHEVYLSTTLDSDLGSSTDWVTENTYDPHAEIAGYITLTYRSANDARVYDGNYGDTGWYAAAPCLSGATIGGSGQGTWCKPRTIRYNRGAGGQYFDAFDTENERRHFACHELGHTLGLFHYTDGCMMESGVSYVVGTHNNNHLYFYPFP